MSGLKLSALYALYPHRLGLCGPQKGKKILYNYLLGKEKNTKKLKEILKEFHAFYNYYCLIAQYNNIQDPFDERVVEAYWVGNKLLKRVPTEGIKKMILQKFTGPDLLSLQEVKKRIQKIPQGAKPHHSFHVFILGAISGRIVLKGKLIDICRIGWAKVKKIRRKKILADYQEIKKFKNRFVLCSSKEKEFFWDKNLASEIKIGDWVSLHWENVVEVLSPRKKKNLENYTKLTLSLL